MLVLFGRNPVITAIVGVALLAGGLALHARFLPWIGGVLIVVGGAKVALQRGRGGNRYSR